MSDFPSGGDKQSCEHEASAELDGCGAYDDDKRWESSILPSLTKLFHITEVGYSKNENSNELLGKVWREVNSIREELVKVDKKSGANLADKIGEKVEIMKVLIPFMAQVYKEISNGYELKCLCDWQHLLLILTNYSDKFCVKIVKENVHMEMIKQLIDLPRALEHQELLADLIKMAMFVMLTLIEQKELRHYFRNCCYTEILLSYTPSNNFSIGKLAKISLAILYQHLDKDTAKKQLSLSSRDIDIILKILSDQTLSEDEEMECWHFLSKDGLILSLKGFCSIESNCINFVKQGGVDVLNTVLDCKNEDSLKGTLILLWEISYHYGPKIVEKTKSFDFIEKIRLLPEENGDLLNLKVCLQYSLFHKLPEDEEDCLTYVKTAFEYELYQECADICEKVIGICEPSTCNTMTLLYGKAMYYISRKQLQYIRRISETSVGYKDQRNTCFKELKKAIHLLGSAQDNNFIDAEGKQCLDTAMMLALSESFSLKGDSRCFLCLSKKKKLARSHICPRAILNDFAKACGSPQSGKAFFVSWPWQTLLTGTLKSAGQIVVQILCHDCEGILSKNKSLFLPNFFRKFYNSDPNCIEIEQDIQYDKWLYPFCIGLIFRGMVFQYSGGRDEYLNEDEVYALYVKCREVLLSSSEGPELSLYVAPTKAKDESEIASSLINMVIHHPFHFFFTQNKGVYGSHQVFLHALSYTFQIGMLMTSVNLSLADWDVNKASVISPVKGTFKVLPNHSRREAMPNALWETLLAEAVTMEKEYMEQPQRISMLPLDHLLSVPATSYMKNILTITSNSEGIGKGSVLQGHPKIVSYIPNVFSISHPQFKNSSGNIDLPSNHKILLHLTIPQDDSQVGNTAFIAVGEGRGYGLDKPYLIFHHYEPGLQSNYGYFFSPYTFEFVQYLPDQNPKRFLDKDSQSSGLVKKSKEIITMVLKNKGFRNYQSILYWLQAKRSPVVLDTKCGDNTKCWYCSELCEVCLQSTMLGPSYKESAETILRFCSEECKKVYVIQPEPQSEIFSPNDQESENIKVPNGHREYVHLFSSGKLEDESGCFVTSMSLCDGDGTNGFPFEHYYLNYHLRTPHYQCFYEFFVSDDLQPLDAISYSLETVCNLFDESDEEDIKTSVLGIFGGVIIRSGCLTISELLEKIQYYNLVLDLNSLLIGSENKKNEFDLASAITESQTPRNSLAEPIVVITPQQLLKMLPQCGDSEKKVLSKLYATDPEHSNLECDLD